jgi:hypothetical protein
MELRWSCVYDIHAHLVAGRPAARMSAWWIAFPPLYILILFDLISLWNGISEYEDCDTNFMHTAGIQHAVLHPCKMDGSMGLDLASCTLTEIPKHVIAGEISFDCPSISSQCYIGLNYIWMTERCEQQKKTMQCSVFWTLLFLTPFQFWSLSLEICVSLDLALHWYEWFLLSVVNIYY